MLEFTPQDNDAALFASTLHNLTNIQTQAARYTNKSDRREAVLVVLTDSFNGMDLNARRRVSRCGDNETLTNSLAQTLRAVSDATHGNLKVYLLAIGAIGEAGRYTLEGDLSSRCSIRTVQKDVVDARSFRSLNSALRSGQGGFAADASPLKLLSRMQGQFESLRRAYEVQYAAPASGGRPRTFGVRVSLGDETCEDAIEEAYGFLRHAQTATSRHTRGEVALLLASLIISFFFLPRSIGNLASGAGANTPRRRRKKGKKKRRRKQ